MVTLINFVQGSEKKIDVSKSFTQKLTKNKFHYLMYKSTIIDYKTSFVKF